MKIKKRLQNMKLYYLVLVFILSAKADQVKTVFKDVYLNIVSVYNFVPVAFQISRSSCWNSF